MQSKIKRDDGSSALTSEFTACDLVLLGLMRGKKAVHVYEIRITCFVLCHHPPLPPKLRCTALSSAG